MKLNYSEGFYNLSFFNINIDTQEELTKQVLEREDSTFVHEFIHYLQDLVLPYSIRFNLSNVRWFFNILKVAHNEGYIDRPFDKWNEDSFILHTQLNRSFGRGPSVNYVTSIGTITADYEIVSGYDGHLKMDREHRVYQYFAEVFEPGKAMPIIYNLGARDILEYIAYKIELRFFPNRPAAPQMPYESVDWLFDKYGLSLVSDDIRVCIEECCLYNDTPIHFLLMRLLSNDEFRKLITTSSYEDVYKYLLSLTTVTRDGQSEALITKTKRRLNQFEQELQMQYSGFDEIGKWISKVHGFVEHRLYGRFLFSDMYKMNKDEMLNFINETINCIGVPLLLNSKKQCISIKTGENEVSQFVQFYIMQNFLRFVRSKEKICPIYTFCKANGGQCNSKCVLNKDNRIEGNLNCYYKKFLETYGLIDIKFN